MKDFILDIKKLRKEHNLTQLQLAEMLDVTDKVVSKWETNRGKPSEENISKICELFNIDKSQVSAKSKLNKKLFIGYLIISVFTFILSGVFSLLSLNDNVLYKYSFEKTTSLQINKINYIQTYKFHINFYLILYIILILFIIIFVTYYLLKKFNKSIDIALSYEILLVTVIEYILLLQHSNLKNSLIYFMYIFTLFLQLTIGIISIVIIIKGILSRRRALNGFSKRVR